MPGERARCGAAGGAADTEAAGASIDTELRRCRPLLAGRPEAGLSLRRSTWSREEGRALDSTVPPGAVRLPESTPPARKLTVRSHLDSSDPVAVLGVVGLGEAWAPEPESRAAKDNCEEGRPACCVQREAQLNNTCSLMHADYAQAEPRRLALLGPSWSLRS